MLKYVWSVTKTITSILDLWEGRKIYQLFPAALEKNLFFKEYLVPEDRFYDKYDDMFFLKLSVQNLEYVS